MMESDMFMGFQDHEGDVVNAGDSPAQDLLENALRIKSGMDGDRDMGVVIGGLEEALDFGSAEAARQLGMCYAYGDGVLQNDKYATMYYRKGAELGDPECMYRLFRNLSIGVGSEVNLDEADLWLERAADAGHSAAIATLEHYRKTGMLSRELKESWTNGNAGNRDRSVYIERVSPSSRHDLNNIAVLDKIEVATQKWDKVADTNSGLALLAIYIIAGIVSGILLKSVYENNISFMGSSSLITNFNSAGTFMAYMAVIGGLLGLAMGFLMVCFVNKVRETLFLYIPVLAMPLIIMCLSSMIMTIAKGVWGLILGILQIAVYVVIGYSVFASSSN